MTALFAKLLALALTHLPTLTSWAAAAAPWVKRHWLPLGLGLALGLQSLRLGWAQDRAAEASRDELVALETLRGQNGAIDRWRAAAARAQRLAEERQRLADANFREKLKAAQELLGRPKAAGGCQEAWGRLFEALEAP